MNSELEKRMSQQIVLTFTIEQKPLLEKYIYVQNILKKIRKRDFKKYSSWFFTIFQDMSIRAFKEWNKANGRNIC